MGKVAKKKPAKQPAKPRAPKWTIPKVVAGLRERGAEADKAHLYADLFVEYQEAMKNIRRVGAVTADRRTGKPMQNPYLPVRDRALANLSKLGRTMDVAWLWE